MALATVEKKLPDVDKALAIRDNLVGLLPTLSVCLSFSFIIIIMSLSQR